MLNRYLTEPVRADLAHKMVFIGGPRQVGKTTFALSLLNDEKMEQSPACQYFRERTGIPEFYQVHLGTKNQGNAQTGTRILPFTTFCLEKNLP